MRTEKLSLDSTHGLWAHDGSRQPGLLFLAHSGPEGGTLLDVDATTGPDAPRRVAHHATMAAFLSAWARFRRRRLAGSPGAAVLVMEPSSGGRASTVARALGALARRGVRVHRTIVGEPASRARAGDTVCNAARGRMSGELTVRGIQGHVAYPDLADNPIHRFGRILAEIESLLARFDGDDASPANVAITTVHAGTGATNVIPGELRAELDLHLGPDTAPGEARHRIEALLARHGPEHAVRWNAVFGPYRTEGGELLEAVVEAVEDECGSRPRLECAGARTVASGVAPAVPQVLAVGAVNRAVDANQPASVAELERLSRIYEGVLERLLSP